MNLAQPIGEYERIAARQAYVGRFRRRRVRPLPAAQHFVSPVFVTLVDDTIAELNARVPKLEPLAPRTGTITPGFILNVVSKAFQIPAGDIRGRGRTQPVARARFVYCDLLRKLMGWSLNATARYVDRDHTSIMAAIRRCTKLRESDPDYAARYEAAHGKFVRSGK